jgi:hypothetical protein
MSYKSVTWAEHPLGTTGRQPCALSVGNRFMPEKDSGFTRAPTFLELVSVAWAPPRCLCHVPGGLGRRVGVGPAEDVGVAEGGRAGRKRQWRR